MTFPVAQKTRKFTLSPSVKPRRQQSLNTAVDLDVQVFPSSAGVATQVRSDFVSGPCHR